MDNTALQCLCLVVLFLLAAVGASAPICLKRGGGRWLSLGSCFGAGVIIAVGIVHLLQDSNESWEAYFSSNTTGGGDADGEPLGLTYPVAGALAVAGCLLLMYIEELATYIARRDQVGPHARGKIWAVSPSYGTTLNGSDTSRRASDVSLEQGPAEDALGMVMKPARAAVVVNGACLDSVQLISAEEESGAVKTRNSVSSPGGEAGHDRGHSHGGAGYTLASGGISAFVMLFALSFHSVIEGIAIGIQDTPSETLGLFAAVASHKAFAAFALGVELQRHVTKLSTLVQLVLLFSIMTPIGMGIGMGIGAQTSSGTTLAKAIVESLATGTFLFIGFVEVLPHEFASRDDRFPKLFAVTLGAAVVCATQIID